ncbi:MAG TPA: serine/threonine-protein kinase [Tepidisphaeraceae bacterium]|jgi:predicted Ser/Thr protein kinase
MSDQAICERCGAAMGPDAAQGLCPACLLEQGLRESQADTIPSNAAVNSPTEIRELARLFPQLEILELLGRGGMGVVYKARQRGLDRLVALKILPAGVDRNPGFQERFIREARSLARLNHPNIVAVYDFGQMEGRYYFLMEFVDGANLRAMLQGGHLTPQEALAIVPQLCDALQFAHEEGIVHRDIKPENILLDRKGRVKIADFGLAKLLSGAVPQDPYTLTMPRQVLGTPHYMAPEQFERPGTVDHRADIYSMGVVFYEMLTGELPLGRFPPPSRKVQLDVRLDEVVLRTLEKEPEHRYQRAGEVKTELATMSVPPPVPMPSTWHAGNAGRDPAPPAGQAARVSPYAIAGSACALLFPMVLLLRFLASPDTVGGPFADSPMMTREVILVLAGACAVLSCGFGVAGLRQIPASGGRLYGIRLALAVALAYPLAVYNLMIVALVKHLLAPHFAHPPGRLALLGWIIAIAADVLIIRWLLCRATRRPLVSSAQPPAPLPPTRPGQYALPPRRRVGCGLGVVLLLLIGLLGAGLVVALLVPAYVAREQRYAQLASGEGTVRADVQSDSGDARIPHTYRFNVQAPPGTKTTVWAEVWRDGQRDPAPGFGSMQRIIPPAGQWFGGVVTFKLGPPRPDGRIDAGWQISGNAGSLVTEESAADPFAGLPVRDSTWGTWTGSWSVPPGRPMQILVLRAAKGQLVGSADDPQLVGHADAEIRMFVRFDPLTPEDQTRHGIIGEPTTPSGGGSPAAPQTHPSPGDSTRPMSETQPPAIRGTAAEGIAR